MLGVSHKDALIADHWLRWVAFLSTQKRGDCSGFDLVAMLTHKVPEGRIELPTERSFFRSRIVRTPDEHEHGYPGSASHLFLRSLEYCEQHFPGSPVLWIEPDAIPLKPGWFGAIAKEYVTCKSPFMGHLEPLCQPKHLAGVAVYPPDWRLRAPLLAGVLDAPDSRVWGKGKGQAFDTYAAPDVYPQAKQARTIQQVWKAPAMTISRLGLIDRDTVLFHQCKTGTLIRSLAQIRYPDFEL